MNVMEKAAIPSGRNSSDEELVASWLTAFEEALVARDTNRIAGLFVADSHWRDLVAFTWHIRSRLGADEIAEGLAEAQAEIKAHGFQLSPHRYEPRRVRRHGVDALEAFFDFETELGRGSGVLRLVPSEGGEEHRPAKAWVLSTALQELKGFEEQTGENRPSGEAYSRNFGGANWQDLRTSQSAYEDRDPAVLVIGGGQAGLDIAARLGQLGVDTLVIDRHERIGDNWRKRYHSLALHNETHANHLPYLPFPPTWPNFIPKDMLAGWFEFYAFALEINFWTSTEFVSGNYDEDAQCWTARLRLADGTEREMRPRHIVFANGVSGISYVPELPGLDDFKGEVVHSEGFKTGARWAGKKAMVLGTGNSGHDVAQDLHSHDVDTTIIQRGSTTVVSIESATLNYAMYKEGPSIEDCDLLAAAATFPLIVRGYQMAVKRMVENDKELIAGLKAKGFKYDLGDDGTGHQMKYQTRGGGYYLDAGCSGLIIDGEIGLLQFDTVEKFVAEGAQLKDGTVVAADLLVLATGYYQQLELVRRLLGDDVADRIGPIWGWGDDGEMRNMWKRTAQPGLWFIAGSLTQCRSYSKYLALQIKAQEEGMIGPL